MGFLFTKLIILRSKNDITIHKTYNPQIQNMVILFTKLIILGSLRPPFLYTHNKVNNPPTPKKVPATI